MNSSGLPRNLRARLKAQGVIPAGQSKYGNKPTYVDGIRFMSRKEARRYPVLKEQERKGEITGLELQPRYKLHVGAVVIGTYVADFRYVKGGETVVEDVKSAATAKKEMYVWKKRHFEAEYGIRITET